MNMNEYCWVKLTTFGRAIHRNEFDELNAHYPKAGLHYIPPETNADGWSRFQLWSLMHLYGKHVYNGQMDLPFGTEIIFAEPNQSNTGDES